MYWKEGEDKHLVLEDSDVRSDSLCKTFSQMKHCDFYFGSKLAEFVDANVATYHDLVVKDRFNAILK